MEVHLVRAEALGGAGADVRGGGGGADQARGEAPVAQREQEAVSLGGAMLRL